MAKTILSIKDIIKRFAGTIALKGVSMELHSNEILALVGENGAGKSTLMKILSGIYPYGSYEGMIEIDDKPCMFRNPQDSEKAGIAMIYQELNLELDLSVAENILLGRYPKNKLGFIDWKQLHMEAEKALEMLDMKIDTHMTVRSMSPSMQQIISIARALYRKPKILILDEPTSVLTEAESQNLMKILVNLKEKGISCIYISHKLEEIFSLCDRTIVFRDGYKISEFTKENGYDSERIIEDMIGRHLDMMYPKREPHIGEEVLRIENFCVPHPSAFGKSIIKDVSFTLKKGEILGLAGLVGSGRSELMEAIFAASEKTNGILWLNGKRVVLKSPVDAIDAGLGFLSEDRKRNGFVHCMNIRENMTLASIHEYVEKMFINSKKETEKAQEYFEKLQVKANNLDTAITSLSGGNQQKVILAKWLMSNIRVLMLDEPTRGIDVGTKSEIYKLMQELTDMGISIIMVSSEMPELIAMCDRILVLGKGVVQAEFLHGEADETKLLRAASCT